MALLGRAAVAMWWNMAAGMRKEFEDWHSHEHFPERMSIPGFLRGSRWADNAGGEGFFVLYELDAYETLSSPHYLRRLNEPTPWSAKMMPHHRDMVRSQCRVDASAGAGLARHALTLRLAPAQGRQERLRGYLGQLGRDIALRPGTTAAHLLLTQTPELPKTSEEKIRGNDQVADWIYLVGGYEEEALARLAHEHLCADSLERQGASPGVIAGTYTLSHACLAAELPAPAG